MIFKINISDLGKISLIFSLIMVVVTFLADNMSFGCKLLLIIISLIISAISIIVYNRLKKRTIKINNNREIKLIIKDLFDCEEIIVIPVNCCFDTTVGSGIVSEKSIHGQFIKKYVKNIDELNEKIDIQLSKQPYEIVNKIAGKNKRYPVGTIVEYECKNKKFYLLAISEFDQNNVAHTDFVKICEALICLLKHANKNSQGHNIAIPLIGTGLSRTGSEYQTMLNFIISIIKSSKYCYPKTITICLTKENTQNFSLMHIN